MRSTEYPSICIIIIIITIRFLAGRWSYIAVCRGRLSRRGGMRPVGEVDRAVCWVIAVRDVKQAASATSGDRRRDSAGAARRG